MSSLCEDRTQAFILTERKCQRLNSTLHDRLGSAFENEIDSPTVHLAVLPARGPAKLRLIF